MQPLKACVHNGRLVLDEPTELREGEVVDLVPLDEVLAGGGDSLDDEERARRQCVDRAGHRGREGGSNRGRARSDFAPSSESCAPVKVELSDEADAQVLEIDGWWREHRGAEPDLHRRARWCVPGPRRDAGARHDVQASTRTVRRLLLRRPHDQLYFVQETERVYVLAVWSAFRGQAPKL